MTEEVLIVAGIAIGLVALLWFERRAAGRTPQKAAGSDKRQAFVPWLQSQGVQPAQVFLSRYNVSGIAHDPQGRRIALLTPNRDPEVFPYADVLGSEVIVNGDVVSRAVNEGVLARSVAGGVLFGAAGAIIGGATASRRMAQTVTSIQLRVVVNDTNAPTRFVTFVAARKPVQLESALAVMDITPHGDVYEWQDRLGVIMQQTAPASTPREGPRSLFSTGEGSVTEPGAAAS